MHAKVLVVLAVLLGGCVASPHPPTAPSKSGAAHAPTFLSPVPLAPVSDEQGEFPLAVSADGQTLLTCTHGGFTGPSPKYASVDGGRSWNPVTTPPTGASGDCWVTIGSDGAWYFVDSEVMTNTVSATTDHGKTWIQNRLATPPVGGTADRPYMAALGGARVGLTYVEDYLAPGDLDFVSSSDHGATWTTPVAVSKATPSRSNVMHGPIVPDPDGSVIRVPVFRFGGTDYPMAGPAHGDFHFALSRDHGVTWTDHPVLPTVTALFVPPAAARAGDGTLYWAYQVQNGSKEDLLVTLSRDDGATWSAPSRVAGGWSNIGYMWMAGAPDGTAVISFDAEGKIVDPSANGESLILLGIGPHATSPLRWSTVVGPAQNAEFSTVAIDPAGHVFVSYRLGGTWLVQRSVDGSP